MDQHYDVIVIGAGVSGLYSIYRLRHLGLEVQAFEAGSGVGGTWYWNRYPGARFDSESYSYQYSFAQELLDEWRWSEQFAGQPEIERYLNFVADKFDLRSHIEFNSRVRAVTYDDARELWTVETERGVRATAQFVVCATGILSAHQFPRYPGVENFRGLSLHTARWPKERLDFTTRRVGIIGTGPTAVQIIQSIAPECARLSVFQRTANWCTPLQNRVLSHAEREAQAASAQDIFELCSRTFGGFIHQPDMQDGAPLSTAERWAKYDELYARGGFALWLANYHDVFTQRAVADDVSAFLASKIRARVKDPVMADKLIPKSHPFGTKRPPGEKNYYEVFNLPQVDLIDLRATPIETITPTGIRLQDGTHFDLDVIIYATGFQSLTGELLRLNIRGEAGLTLNEKWSDGPKTYLGVQFGGFPNLFAVLGPHNPATFCNITRCVESNVDWIANCIRYMREQGYRRIEATREAEEAWTEQCYESVKGTLLDAMQDSWFFGNHNAELKAPRFLMYFGGVPEYRRIFAETAAQGYSGFRLT